MYRPPRGVKFSVVGGIAQVRECGMTPSEIRHLLEAVRGGGVAVEEAAARLASGGVAEMGFATLDLHRKDRCGFPEVIFAEGKTAEWVEAGVRRLAAAGQDC